MSSASKTTSPSSKGKNDMTAGQGLLAIFIIIVLIFGFAAILWAALNYIIPRYKASTDTTYDIDTYEPINYWAALLTMIVLAMVGAFFKSNQVLLMVNGKKE